MPKNPNWLLLLASLALMACGSSDADSTSTPSAPDETVEPAADPAPEPEPTDDDEQAPVAARSTLSVTRVSGTEQADATAGREQTTVSVAAGDEGTTVELTDFVFYCAPAPAFDVELQGDVIVLQAQPPEGPATRCIGPHAVVLRLEGVPDGEHTLSVRNVSGDEVATATIGG